MISQFLDSYLAVLSNPAFYAGIIVGICGVLITQTNKLMIKD